MNNMVDKPFDRDFIYLTEEGAEYLVEKHIRMVGIDYLSIGHYEKGQETHRLLLGGGVWIIEGLFLGGVEPGEYDFVCLPLRLEGADGAPARAILRPG
jgi:arylformamidase